MLTHTPSDTPPNPPLDQATQVLRELHAEARQLREVLDALASAAARVIEAQNEPRSLVLYRELDRCRSAAAHALDPAPFSTGCMRLTLEEAVAGRHYTHLEFHQDTVAVWACPVTQWHIEELKNGTFYVLIERSEFTCDTLKQAIHLCQQNY